MDNMEHLKRLTEVFNVDKVVTSEDVEQVLKGIVKIMASFKKDNEVLNDETKQMVNDLLEKVTGEHADLVAQIQDNKAIIKGELLDEFSDKLAEVRQMLKEAQETKPENGKDADPVDKAEIVSDVLSQIVVPDPIIETGEETIAKINSVTDEDSKIDASRIKNLPEATTSRGGSTARNLFQLHDVQITDLEDGQIIAYDATQGVFVNEDPTGGSGTVGPGTANQIAYFDTTTTVNSLATATYPSLTELSYVKGVTSAIQTQLNAKGSGDVIGVASSTDNAIARFDLTTGKLIQNSGVTIDDSDNISAATFSAGGSTPSSTTYFNTNLTGTIVSGTVGNKVAFNRTDAGGGTITGFRSDVLLAGAVSSFNMIGLNFGVGTSISGATLSNGQGLQGNVTNVSGATFSTATGGYFGLVNAGTGTTWKGIDINIVNSGTLTDTYGVYIGDVTSGTQTNQAYSLYSVDTNARNYFGGKVGIGNVAPVELLTLGTAGSTAGTFSLAGATSGKATVVVPAVAGTPTLTMPNNTGTLALTNQSILQYDYIITKVSTTYTATSTVDGSILSTGTTFMTVLQAAGDALTAGGNILLKAGTYTATTGFLFKYAGTRIYGVGSGTIITCDGASVATLFSFNANSLQNCGLYSMLLTNSNGTNGIGFKLQNQPFFQMKDVNFSNFSVGLQLIDTANLTFYNYFENLNIIDCTTCIDLGPSGNPVNDNTFTRIRTIATSVNGYGVRIRSGSNGNKFYSFNAEPAGATSSKGISIEGASYSNDFYGPYLEASYTNINIDSTSNGNGFWGGESVAAGDGFTYVDANGDNLFQFVTTDAGHTNAGWIVKTKVFQTDMASNTTLTADPTLQFPIPVYGNYTATFRVFYSVGNAAADFKYDISAPAGAVVYASRIDAIAGGTPAFRAVDVSSPGSTSLLTAAASIGYVEVTLVVYNDTTPGTVAFRWAQVTSNVTPTSVLVGSSVSYLKS